MDIEKLFHDLESNQSQECEEAKKILVDLFNQIAAKDISLVHSLMDYFLKTGSQRVLEVLVRLQQPHANSILDRLSEWLRMPSHRLQALTLFGFVVRKHPTWLYEIKNHKIIKDILKLLQNEKEIVPLMSALLCIVTLLPIIPTIASNFLNDLFEVFGHLASWSCQNPNNLSEEKLLHLQMGLQMLFHRLYGMYPCNFLMYLNEFIKKDEGAIFQHTIKPLLDTVRLHPMLVTATPEKEMNNARWRDKEAHDVVVECAELSVANQEFHPEYVRSEDTSISVLNQQLYHRKPMVYSGIASPFQPLTDREQLSELKKGDTIWSPYTEIISSASAMPHTPTPSYGVPMSSGSSTGAMGAIMGVTGSSPPEAAVEATPETTPMKELTMKPSANPHAVVAIFASSQPASPMRRDPGLQFTFPDSPGPSANQQVLGEYITIAKVPTKLYDQKMQHVLNDRHQMRNHHTCYPKTVLSPLTIVADTGLANSSNNGTPLFDSHAISQEDEEVRGLTSSVPQGVKVAPEDTAKRNFNCGERKDSLRSVGGVQVASNRSMRNKLENVCQIDSSCYNVNSRDGLNGFATGEAKVRRTQSCPTIDGSLTTRITTIKIDKPDMLQKSDSKPTALVTIRTGAYRKQSCSTTSRVTQTIQTWPKNYECMMFDLISENNKLRSGFSIVQPQELLKQYIDRAVRPKNPGYRSEIDQDAIHLLYLQLQYEQYRREIHAERNRRLMGRSRDIRSLEREQERLKDNLKTFHEENRRLSYQFDNATKLANENERKLTDELNSFKARYQEEVELKKMLQSNNESLQCRLNEEIQKRMDLTFKVDTLRGQIFDMRNELQHAQTQAEQGLQCKQELVRLESEFLVMGEVQIKLRDRLAEVDNLRARGEEINHLQESYNIEIKDLRRALEEKASQFESAKHKLSELQTQIVNNEKVVADQKRLLKNVKDEYEEKFKALNTKYEVQKNVILQMEETFLYLFRNHLSTGSPDADRSDIASFIERNSPLSTSLASSDSLPPSLPSVTDIKNLQALADSSNTATAASGSNSSTSTTNISYSHFMYSKHYQPSVVEAKVGIRGDISGESTATTSSTHTLDIPVPEASKSHYHHQQKQKQKNISQNPRTKHPFIE